MLTQNTGQNNGNEEAWTNREPQAVEHGQSGNPGGRPKRDVAAAVFEGNEEAIYKALCKTVLKGDPRVFVALAQRAYGKLGEPVELSVTEGLAERLAAIRRAET